MKLPAGMKDSDGILKLGYVVTFIFTGVTAVILIVLLLVIRITHHYDGINCRHYATTWNRPTKFVNYTFWSWDCLTPNPDSPGTWIPTNQLRGVQ